MRWADPHAHSFVVAVVFLSKWLVSFRLSSCLMRMISEGFPVGMNTRNSASYWHVISGLLCNLCIVLNIRLFFVLHTKFEQKFWVESFEVALTWILAPNWTHLQPSNRSRARNLGICCTSFRSWKDSIHATSPKSRQCLKENFHTVCSTIDSNENVVAMLVFIYFCYV